MARATVSSNQECPICQVIHNIELPEGISAIKFEDDYNEWKLNNGYIQKIFNYLSADDRELLLSGMCDKAWDLAFSEEDEDE